MQGKAQVENSNIVFILCFTQTGRNAKKSEDKVKNIEEELAENVKKNAELEAEFKKLEEDAAKVLEAYQNAMVCFKLLESLRSHCSRA